MKMKLIRLCPIAALALLAGCATTPDPKVYQPMTALPAPSDRPAPANGTIFQTAESAGAGYSYHPLFEDRRARSVGDVLTIDINEDTAASKNSDSTASRTGTSGMSVKSLSGLPGKSFLGANLDANSASTFEGKGGSSSNNTFTGIITVTVIKVLSNGNLVVSGEKQIGINQGSEFVRFSGIVNPATIVNNTVSSTQVADARLAYRGKGYIDEAQTMGWLARFFLSVLPF